MINYYVFTMLFMLNQFSIKGENSIKKSNIYFTDFKSIKNYLNVSYLENEIEKEKYYNRTIRWKRNLNYSNSSPSFETATNEKFENMNQNNLSKNNYEETNVSVIIDSEAGPIVINDFAGGSMFYKSLTATTEKSNYESSYDDYEESSEDYGDEEQPSDNDSSKFLSKNIDNAETLWNIFNMFSSVWNSYSNWKDNEKTKRATDKGSTEIAEGRYIKGDPLKGYYDFVITEGSYKFWAAFQLATAVLIIYSTFAAIYYSKVNPLVGDYDYVDYLGGGRSFSDDADFVDTESENEAIENLVEENTSSSSVTTNSSSHYWLPKFKYSLVFILKAIDKLPIRD